MSRGSRGRPRGLGLEDRVQRIGSRGLRVGSKGSRVGPRE